jgi:hypothetical protein
MFPHDFIFFSSFTSRVFLSTSRFLFGVLYGVSNGKKETTPSIVSTAMQTNVLEKGKSPDSKDELQNDETHAPVCIVMTPEVQERGSGILVVTLA